MIIIAQNGQKLDVTYSDGYYVISKVLLTQPKSSSEALSQEFTPKEYKTLPKTYAHVTGLQRQCEEWDCVIEDMDSLVKSIKLEEGIKNAKRAKALKDRGGIRKC